ncbi:hypothetical protein NA56DRAFT_705004 [Hyaloscypha hepaticicola]|uniref:Uncharacterized protein n=1 Tax=Hyaloscypha hepaticicola TaxID=2082293 RepID=A0A2J6Q1P7_9HELO|nr:hypothetical protein NA56DRAFT_705004 [Hyaloscypha hepaticicola]
MSTANHQNSPSINPDHQPGSSIHAADPFKRCKDFWSHDFASLYGGNGARDQVLARADDRLPDILVVNLFVLRYLLGIKLINFPDLIHTREKFRAVQLHHMNYRNTPSLHYQFHTKEHAIALALAVSNTTLLGPCNHCQDLFHEPSIPDLLPCRRLPNFMGQACGNCGLHNRIRECSFYDGLEAPIVFYSKDNEKYTAREDDCIILLRTCTKDQAPDIQRKYFPNRYAPTPARRDSFIRLAASFKLLNFAKLPIGPWHDSYFLPSLALQSSTADFYYVLLNMIYHGAVTAALILEFLSPQVSPILLSGGRSTCATLSQDEAESSLVLRPAYCPLPSRQATTTTCNDDASTGL